MEGCSTAPDYDHCCREELPRCGADGAHVPPLATASPTLLFLHCRDGEQEENLGTDRTNTVVSAVVEDTFPTASTEHKAELVDAWEKVLDSGGQPSARADEGCDADLISALDNMEQDDTEEYDTYTAAPVWPVTCTIGAQTGGMTTVGRVVWVGSPKAPPSLDAGTLLKRLRVTLPPWWKRLTRTRRSTT